MWFAELPIIDRNLQTFLSDFEFFESYFEGYFEQKPQNDSNIVSNYFQRLHSYSGALRTQVQNWTVLLGKTILKNYNHIPRKTCLWRDKLIPQDWANKKNNLFVEMVEIKTSYFEVPVNEPIQKPLILHQKPLNLMNSIIPFEQKPIILLLLVTFLSICTSFTVK